MRIEIPVFDGFDELDAIATYKLLRTAGELNADVCWHVAQSGRTAPARSLLPTGFGSASATA
jgi:hypothetical protein